MFEKILSDTLAKYLGDYVKGFNTENLKIAIWNGEVALENLKLRKKALNGLGLPITVKEGFIGKLQLKVPWHNIKNEALIVLIERVFLIAGPKDEVKWNEKEIEKREQAAKQEKLKWVEMIKATNQTPNAQMEGNQLGPLGALITKIVDNLQFSINDVHIRYEDDRISPQQPFSMGITLEHLSAQSANSNWVPTFLTSDHKLIHKLLSLKNLAVYWNPNEEKLNFSSPEEMGRILNDLIYKDKNPQTNHHYILSPVCGSLKLLLNKSNIPDKTCPKYTFNFEFENISLAAEEPQFRQLVDLLDYIALSVYNTGGKYRKFRPPEGVKQNAKARWHFARDCLLYDIREKKRKWSSEYLSQRKQNKIEYVSLYKLKKKAEATAINKARLDELELKLSFEDIVFFRSLADAELKKEQAYVDAHKKENTSQGWIGWIWGSTPASSQSKTVEKEEWTLQQKQEFYAAIEYDVTQAMSTITIDKDYVQMAFNFRINTGSITLRTRPDLKRPDIASVVFNTFTINLIARSDSFKVQASLARMQIFDRYTPNTRFPCLVSPLITDNNDLPVFSLVFEQNPLDFSCHYNIEMNMLPLEIIYNKACLDRIVAFFIKSGSTTLQEIEFAAKTHVEALKTKTAYTLAKELESHKILNVNINISAPKIVVPENFLTEDTLVLVIDLGELKIKSGRTKQAKPQRESLLTVDALYDEYSVQMTSMQLLMSTNSSRFNPEKSMQLVDKFDINVSLHYCIKTDILLTKLRVLADLPALKLSISLDKILKLLRILSTLTGTSSQPKSNLSRSSGISFTDAVLLLDGKISSQSASPEQSEEVVKLMVESKFMECTFSVPEVSILISEDSVNESSVDLIKLKISGFGGHLVKRTYDLGCFMYIHAITIEDFLQSWGEDFRYLATSITEEQTSPKSDNDPSKEHMIKAHFSTIGQDSPKYNNLDSSLALSFNSLRLMCNPETIVHLSSFVHKVLKALQAVFIPGGEKQEAPSQKKKLDFNTLKTVLKVTAEVRSLEFTLNKDGNKLSSCSVSNAAVLFEQFPNTWKSAGSLENISIQDLTAEGKKYRSIFGAYGNQLIDWAVQTHSPLEPNYPGHNLAIQLRMNSIEFVFLQRFLNELQEYFVKLSSSLTETSSSVAEKSSPPVSTPTAIKFDVEIVNPHIIIPKSSSSGALLVADLGRISVFNTFQIVSGAPFEKILVSISAMNLKSGHVSRRKDQFGKIVDDIQHILLEIVRPVDKNNQNPDWNIQAKISPINIHLTESQYALLSGIYRTNFKEKSSRNAGAAEVPRYEDQAAANVLKTSEVVNQEEDEQPSNLPAWIRTKVSVVFEQISLELISISPEGSVVSFNMRNIVFLLLHLSDDSMKGNVSMRSVQLNDTRPRGDNLIKQLFGPSSSSSNSPLLRLHFSKLGAKQTYALHIDHPRLVIVPEALFAIYEFIWSGLTFQDSKSTPTRNDGAETQTNSHLELSLNFTNSEICIPEDATNKFSRAFVGTSSLLVKYVLSPTETKWEVVGKQLELYKCHVHKPLDSAISILEPIDFSVICNEVHGKGPVYQATIDAMHVTFSYRDFLMLNGIIRLFSGKIEKTKTEPEPSPKHQKKQFTGQILAKSGGVRLTLIDDYKTQNVALADIRLFDPVVEIFDNQSKIQSFLRIDYYNQTVAAWEPLVEQWHFHLHIDKIGPDAKIHLRGSERLNINITKPFFDTLLRTTRLWNKDNYRTDLEATPKPLAMYPFVLRNETGQKLRYWFSDHMDEQEESGELDNNREHPLKVRSLNTRSREMSQKTQGTLRIHVTPWNPIDNLSIERVGTYELPLTPKPKDMETPKLIYEVSFREGSKVLSFRSNVVIKNLTKVPLEVTFEKVQHSQNIEHTDHPQLCPGETQAVPLAYASVGRLRFRPNSKYSWSQKNDDSAQLACCRPTIPDYPFYFLINVSGDNESSSVPSKQYTISLLPPLILENLLACRMDFQICDKATGRVRFQSSLDSGADFSLHELELDAKNGTTCKIVIPGYSWSTPIQLTHLMDIQNLQLHDQNERPLVIYAHTSNVDGALKVSVYCRYWMINRTGLSLMFRSRDEDFAPETMASGQHASEVEDYSILLKEPREWYKDLNRSKELAKPFMFSYSALKLFESKTSIKIASSTWSKGISLESAGMEGFLEIADQSRPGRPSKLFQIGVSIDLGKGQFYRTKMITWCPRFILINNSSLEIFYKQRNSDDSHCYSLHPGERIPYHWSSKELPKEMCITVPNAEWSGGFTLDQLGDFAVNIPRPVDGNNSYYLARVQIKFEVATFFVVFNAENKAFPPYRIENATPLTICFYQANEPNRRQLESYQGVAYTWDEPSKLHRLIVEIENSRFKREYNLDIIKTYQPTKVRTEMNGVREDYSFRFEIFADGPTRVLRITDASVFLSPAITSRSNFNMGKKNIAQKEWLIELPGIGLSVVDTTPQELMYVSIDGISVSYSNSKIAQSLECIISNFQIDNQLFETPFPVLLAPRRVTQKKIFHLSVVKSNQYESIDFFLYFSVLVGELDLNLDENFINALFLFANPLLEAFSEKSPDNFNEDGSIMAPVASLDDKKVYFEVLHLNPIKLNLSYASSTSKNETFLRTIVNAIGVTIANLDGAQISLNALFLEHSFATRKELMDRISKHYYRQAIRELYKVVGSFEFLGSPVSLVQNLGTGVYDFFYEPAYALVRSPDPDLILNGFAKGASSLVFKSFFGFINSAKKMSGSAGNGAATLAMDEFFVRERQMTRRENPSDFVNGIWLGLKDLSFGVYSGISGVISQPILGMQREGTIGLAKGVGRALLGVTIKPVVGMIDLANRTTQAISHTTSMFEAKPNIRMRPSRYFGPDKILQAFSFEKSYGQTILYRLDAGKYREQWYLFHFTLEKHILLVSDKQVFFVNKSNLQKKWSFLLQTVTKVEKVQENIVFHFKSADQIHEPQTDTKIVSISNNQLLEKVFVHLAETVHSEKMKLGNFS